MYWHYLGHHHNLTYDVAMIKDVCEPQLYTEYTQQTTDKKTSWL
jgi:hypothetical protein